jgi:dGTPase
MGVGSQRAVYASDPGKSRGRLVDEPVSPTRSDFRRDCDRIIHSTAFRRLAHKTQVFVFHEGDHYRTRLTHTLEVAQIARSIARALRLDEDLAECLALAHDLGHPPFGHSGEHALGECLASHGGFDHNAQALRIVTALERRYPAFNGLNLTWETLEGLVKHNGPLTDRQGKAIGRYREHGVPQPILDYTQQQDLQLWSYAGAEAQVAALSDDIAYDAHDIDDGLRADLFPLDDMKELPLAGDILRETDASHPHLDKVRRGHELVRGLITRMIIDVIGETQRRLDALSPGSVGDIRGAGGTIVALSPAMAEAEKAIKAFLFDRMYRHSRVVRIMLDAEGVLKDLLRHYAKSPGDLPPEWRDSLGADARSRARHVADYVAGMTDRYALAEHRKFFATTPELT